jgi:peptidoglycan/LPS O-acetylase OafA/YrhL
VFFGLTNPRKSGFLNGADYSYGIFLYGFVIQQTFMALAPWGRHWWINIAFAVPAATAVAAISWHVVEKPALALRKPLARLEAAWIARNEARALAQAAERA